MRISLRLSGPVCVWPQKAGTEHEDMQPYFAQIALKSEECGAFNLGISVGKLRKVTWSNTSLDGDVGLFQCDLRV